jgi:hypothetical protein
MKGQMTGEGIVLLAGMLVLFWAGVAVLVRRHALRRRAAAGTPQDPQS